MIKIKIDEVDNGWIVEHYSELDDIPEDVSTVVFYTVEDLKEFLDVLLGEDI
jgi:hypothetical protein